MEDVNILNKLVDKANLKIQQQCGLRPFNYIEDDQLDDTLDYVWNLLENKSFWKALFGFACYLECGIEQKNKTILLLSSWEYHYNKSCIQSPFVNLEEVINYLKDKPL